MKSAIYMQPVSVAVNALGERFRFYSAACWRATHCQPDWDNSPNLINHAVVAVGFGYDKHLDLEYVVIKNSWGPQWGENGFARIAMQGGEMNAMRGLLIESVAPLKLSNLTYSDPDYVAGLNDYVDWAPKSQLSDVNGILYVILTTFALVGALSMGIITGSPRMTEDDGYYYTDLNFDEYDEKFDVRKHAFGREDRLQGLSVTQKLSRFQARREPHHRFTGAGSLGTRPSRHVRRQTTPRRRSTVTPTVRTHSLVCTHSYQIRRTNEPRRPPRVSLAEARRARRPSRASDIGASRAMSPSPAPPPSALARAQKFLLANFLVCGFCLALTFGLSVPAAGKALASVAVGGWGVFQTMCVVVIFIISGATLKTEEIAEALKSGRGALAYGWVAILGLTPLLGFVLVQLPVTPVEFRYGLSLFCCVPTTLTSGVTLVRNAKGNVALALMLTVTTNLIGVFTVRLFQRRRVDGTASGRDGRDERYGVQRGEIARQAHFYHSYTHLLR